MDVAREFDGLRDARSVGLDGTLGFPPHNLKWQWVPHAGLRVDRRFKGNILSYQAMARDAERRLLHLAERCYPGVMVTFDNTARRQWQPDLWYGSNPYTFRRWLAAARSSVVAPATRRTGWSSSMPGTNGLRARCWNRPGDSAGPTCRRCATSCTPDPDKGSYRASSP